MSLAKGQNIKRFRFIQTLFPALLLLALPVKLNAQWANSAEGPARSGSSSTQRRAPSGPNAQDYINNYNKGQKAIQDATDNAVRQYQEQADADRQQRQQAERPREEPSQAAPQQQSYQPQPDLTATPQQQTPAPVNYQADPQAVQQYSPPPSQATITYAPEPAPAPVEQYQPPQLADFNTSSDAPSILNGKQVNPNASIFSEAAQNAQPLSAAPASGDAGNYATIADSVRASMLHGLQVVGDSADDARLWIRGTAKEAWQGAKDLVHDTSSEVSQGLSDSYNNAQKAAFPVDPDHNIPDPTFIKGARLPDPYADQTIYKPIDEEILQQLESNP